MTLVPVLERLEGLDLSALDAAGAQAATVDAKRLLRFCEATLVRLASANTVDPTESLHHGCGMTASDAARVGRVAETVAEHPKLGEALDSGRIGLGHVDGYTAAARGLNDDQQARLAARQDELLARAVSQTPEEFRRSVTEAVRQIRRDDGETRAAQQRNDRSCRFGNDLRGDGMGWINARFDPETAARLFAALRAERDALMKAEPSLTEEQATADALESLVLGSSRSQRPGLTEVVVFIDLQSLVGGAREGGVSYYSSGEHAPVSTVRRLCCEAEIIPMVLGGDGQPLDVGRSRRLATPAQRRALRKLYATCAHPGCEVAFDDCHIHHLHPWEHGGATDLCHLVPLCSKHHHRVHEGGWTITMDPGRTITLHRPDGEHHATVRWRPPPGEHPQPPPQRAAA